MLWTALLSSLLAVGVHIYLNIHHLQLKLGISPGTGSCNINSSFNCDSVSVSRFAVFGDAPLALWGAWTNAMIAVGIILCLIGLLQNRERVLRLLTFFSGFVAAVSLLMFAISSFVLKTYCLYCMAAYFLSFVTLISLFRIAKPKLQDLKPDLQDLFFEHRWVLGLLIAIPGGTYLSRAMINQSYGLGQLQSVIQDSLETWKQAPVQSFDEKLGLKTPKTSPIKMKIVEFADFKCSHCKRAFPSLDAFALGREDVELTFKSFPLDGSCNKSIPRKGDGSTCTLAIAAFCAEKLSQKGWDLHHWIYDNQEQFFEASNPMSLLETEFKALGLESSAMKTCIEGDEVREQVQRMAEEGANAKIGGTPTIFVNGKLLERGQLLPVLEAVYRSL